MDGIGFLHSQYDPIRRKRFRKVGLHERRQRVADLLRFRLIVDGKVHPRCHPYPLRVEELWIVEERFERLERTDHVKVQVGVSRKIFDYSDYLQIAKAVEVHPLSNRIVTAKVFLGCAFRQQQFVGTCQRFLRITLDKLKAIHFQEGVFGENKVVLQVFFVADLHYRHLSPAGRAEDDGRVRDLWEIIHEIFLDGKRYRRRFREVIAHGKLLNDAIDFFVVLKTLLIAQLILNKQQDEDTRRSAECEPERIDQRIVFLLHEIPNGDFEIVA